ncbi:hypothetical protein C7Y70_02440 [Pseudoalteromonas sp. KS88]|uniref:hypothetical protein n=1 Tax=Pseudoalteromonas sp. KS88 TaxID=2109918 RepID=UPI00108096D2|nr:hypothetical protein [Pseudoalteromonas sp. KS88]TGE85215.1 hypothetical protein C7Y70_02440 [Pseudoalteromonas sp. KS88]
MNYKNVYLPIKALALLSFISIALKYWGPSEVGFYLLLSPYVVLFYLSNANNYRNTKLSIIRGIPAGLTLLLVPALLFGIEPDAQAGIGLMFGLLLQLASISAAELIILFFLNDEQRI